MNVIISGLTAAGKTTHCELMESRFGLRRVSAADALLQAGGLAPPWTREIPGFGSPKKQRGCQR